MLFQFFPSFIRIYLGSLEFSNYQNYILHRGRRVTRAVNSRTIRRLSTFKSRMTNRRSIYDRPAKWQIHQAADYVVRIKIERFAPAREPIPKKLRNRKSEREERKGRGSNRETRIRNVKRVVYVLKCRRMVSAFDCRRSAVDRVGT